MGSRGQAQRRPLADEPHLAFWWHRPDEVSEVVVLAAAASAPRGEYRPVRRVWRATLRVQLPSGHELGTWVAPGHSCGAVRELDPNLQLPVGSIRSVRGRRPKAHVLRASLFPRTGRDRELEACREGDAIDQPDDAIRVGGKDGAQGYGHTELVVRRHLPWRWAGVSDIGGCGRGYGAEAPPPPPGLRHADEGRVAWPPRSISPPTEARQRGAKHRAQPPPEGISAHRL
jgi:hypothetical protein